MKISSYLRSGSASFLRAPSALPWFSPWIPLRMNCKSVTPVANNLILVELSGGKHCLSHSPLYLRLVAQSCLTLCDSVDCSPPGSSVCGTSQARILEWVAISSSRGSSWCRDQICISSHWQAGSLPLSHLGSPFFNAFQVVLWATCREKHVSHLFPGHTT